MRNPIFLFRTLVAVAFLAGGISTDLMSQRAGMPCGVECFEAAAAATAQCRRDGGSFLACLQAGAEAFEACREGAGCDGDPGDLPGLCGLECFESAREASARCREDGGSFWECLGAYGDAVRACREEAGCQTPDHPEPCGSECIGTARDAFRSCREEGGSFAECAEGFLAELGTCREAAGCDPASEEEEFEAVAALVGSGVDFRRGDVNDDGRVNITDPIALLGYLFLGEGAPACFDAADANDDGRLDVSDPTAILGTLFLGGPPLPAPSDAIGFDPTPDDLGCELEVSS